MSETAEQKRKRKITIEEKVMKLVRKANNRGGTDNISVAYLVCREEGEEE